MSQIERNLGVAASLWLMCVAVAAAEPGVNRNGTAYAVGGYDVVAYFADHAPLRGNAKHAATYRDATWLFASAEHRSRFEKSPQTYVPAFLGYCAYGVAHERLVPIDPNAWTIYHGKLYLNYSLAIRQTWSMDIPGELGLAEAYWAKLSH